MLHALSCHLVERLYRHTLIQSDKKSVHIYGMKLMCSTGLSFMSMLTISLVTGKLYCLVSFIAVFFTFRVFSGGYHSTTYRRCFVLTNLVYLSVMLLGSVALVLQTSEIIPFCVLPSSVVIFLYAPIKNINHPLSDRAYQKNKKVIRILVMGVSNMILFLCYFENLTEYLYYPALSLTAVAVMIIPTIVERRNN